MSVAGSHEAADDDVGLLGGTFDPPHVGHLIVAEVARVSLGLDEVRFVVAGQPWMKDDYSPGGHRVEMTRRAVADEPAFVLDSSEVDRSGPTYTADTLEALSRDRPGAELTFIVGADQLEALPDWKRVGRALELARFVVAPRPGHSTDTDLPIAVLPAPAMAVSSSDLRERFRTGRAVRHQLPDPVVDYVREHGLYGASRHPR